MILSLTHFDTPATGETTVPVPHRDTPSQGAAKGDAVRSDRSRSGSFDTVFAHGDTRKSSRQEMVMDASPQVGGAMDGTPQDKTADATLNILDPDRAQNADHQPLAGFQGLESDQTPDTSGKSEGSVVAPSADMADLTVKPDDRLLPTSQITAASPADTRHGLVNALPQAGLAMAFGLMAQSGSPLRSNMLETSATPHTQAIVSGSNAAQFGMPGQVPPDMVAGVFHMRGAGSVLFGSVEPKPQNATSSALAGHLRGAAGTALPTNVVQDKRDPTSPELAAPAASDVTKSKGAQAVPEIGSVLPALSAGVAPVDEVSLSRIGFQSDLGGVADQRPSADIMTAGRADATVRSDLPRQVAAQLADAVQRGVGGDRPIELTLNPAELGRVRISMAPGDGTIIVTVLAERGETLDLMRRHADQLAQDFHDLGYASAEFAFGQTPDDGRGSDQGGKTARGPVVSNDANSSPDAVPDAIRLRADRVDIRL